MRGVARSLPIAAALTSLPSVARAEILQTERTNALLVFIVFCVLVLGFIQASKRGRELFIRRIAGLSAIDEAIGRATELGKKVLYIPGIMSIDENQTIASLAVLRHVARSTARNATELDVPNKDPLAFAAARETVKEAYMEEGRPDLYQEEMVNYVTYDQFAFTASVSGKMVREKPATNFLIGAFYAESLLLAETGQAAGSMQIAGTAEVSQLPFFVVTCDYTLIGEELYAAGAYLSRDHAMLGSIKGQDYTKAFIMLAILAGAILVTAGLPILAEFFSFANGG
ncbi:MAG: hypothetical protein GF355_11425 [Candidatus Eisenbacteria bacterium]|nr:hypothetical protein [Candidatus Eisenbacteria bacterium]